MKSLLVPFLFVLFTVSAAHGELLCPAAPDARPVESITATAGNWANMRNSEGSIRFESTRLFKKGYQILTATDATVKSKAITLQSEPKVFLKEYADFEHCNQKYLETKDKPIIFSDLRFATIEELTSWFGDFSKGSGQEGKKLYELCDGDCSPQYTIVVQEVEKKLNAQAIVVCGPARDKDDDSYLLKLYSTACHQ